MNIQEEITKLLAVSDEVIQAHPTITNIRHELKDIPYLELKAFAATVGKLLQTDQSESRAFIIYSPYANGRMDSDIWLYSTIVKFKPAEVIED